MKRISLRLPDDLHAALVERARREQRSLHNLIVVSLGEAVGHTADRVEQRPAEWVRGLERSGAGTDSYHEDSNALDHLERPAAREESKDG